MLTTGKGTHYCVHCGFELQRLRFHDDKSIVCEPIHLAHHGVIWCVTFEFESAHACQRIARKISGSLTLGKPQSDQKRQQK